MYFSENKTSNKTKWQTKINITYLTEFHTNLHGVIASAARFGMLTYDGVELVYGFVVLFLFEAFGVLLSFAIVLRLRQCVIRRIHSLIRRLFDDRVVGLFISGIRRQTFEIDRDRYRLRDWHPFRSGNKTVRYIP